MPNTHDLAPLFTLSTQRGAPVSLADALGRGAITVAFVGRVTRAGGDAPADRRIRALMAACPGIRDAGIALFVIVSNDREHAKRYVEETGTPFHLLCDDRGVAAAQYGLARRRFLLRRDVRPALFGIDPDGRVRFSRIGDDEWTRKTILGEDT